MSTVFGILRMRRLHNTTRADLIRRTSPSGGSRHPTEGYWLQLDDAYLEAGVYHFCIGPNGLHRIDAEPAEFENLRGVTVGVEGVAGVVIFTSEVERNMYRYREPRTYRTVWLDVAHVIETTQLTATALGLRSRSGVWSGKTLTRLLGLDPHAEPALCAVLICRTPGTAA